eukprot:TRINITY_DN1243_c0_g1_i3.p1 TRINITY_DN1243_c0_g1~~TRINITY_DN1243_c0_g1_i3.p1  ORF type:complete len:815 (+),score=365.10 TRINITY_DN1243_c0_g1_i3:96-2540(+)
MVDLFKELDFEREIRDSNRLEPILKKLCEEETQKIEGKDEWAMPTLDASFNNFVVVTGLPKATSDKIQTLAKVLIEKVFVKLEINNYFKNITFGYTDEKQQSSDGTALVECDSPDNAKLFAQALNNYQLDKAHKILAYNLLDFDQITSSNDVFTPPKLLPKEELQSWVLDPRFRDQFAVRYGNKFQLNWFNFLEKSTDDALKEVGGEFNTDSKVEWSRNGSYLISYTKIGFTLWGGKSLEKIAFFEHKNVKHVEFSYNEKYCISFNGQVHEADSTENFIVWETGLAERLRVFQAGPTDKVGSFKWSYDNSYLAKIGENVLAVYQLPSMNLLEDPTTQKKSMIRVPNIQSFAWSPTANTLAVAAHATPKERETNANVSSKIMIIDIPSRKDRKWRAIPWDMRNVEFFWDAQGSFVIARQERLKNKKPMFDMIHVGYFKKNEIDISDKEYGEKVRNIIPDASARRLAVVLPEIDPSKENVASGQLKYDINILKIDEENNTLHIRDLGRLSKRVSSEVYWSSSGLFFTVANTEQSNPNLGQIEFCYLKSLTSPPFAQIESCKTTTVNYLTQVAWDPSGRFLTTFSARTGTYTIWNGFGETIYRDTLNDLTQLLWRPRPRSLLTPEKEAELAANLKNATKKYEEYDDKIVNAHKYEMERKRKEKKEEFLTYLKTKKAAWENSREERSQLLGFDEDNLTDITIDEIIESEEILDSKPLQSIQNHSHPVAMRSFRWCDLSLSHSFYVLMIFVVVKPFEYIILVCRLNHGNPYLNLVDSQHQFSSYYPTPVSYTHLRAHETDSYLVCRLLLEKKKRSSSSL